MIVALIQIICFVIVYLLLRPLISGAVYFPTSKENIEIIKKMADVKSNDQIVDLGSGDGRIVIALAKAGAKVTGYEINPILVFMSRMEVKRQGLQNQAKIYWKSFWRADLSKFNTIVVYGFPNIMRKLEAKLIKDLKPGTKIISNQYEFPNWKPVSVEKNVYLYIR